MATAVTFVTLLRASASPGFSSPKLSSSLVSPIHAKWTLPGFKGIGIGPLSKTGSGSRGEKPKDHPAAFEVNSKILTEVNKLTDEMKQLRLAVDSASKILSKAVNYYKQIQPINELGVEVHEPKIEQTGESFTPATPATWKENDGETQSTEITGRGDFKRRSPSFTSDEDCSPWKKLKPSP